MIFGLDTANDTHIYDASMRLDASDVEYVELIQTEISSIAIAVTTDHWSRKFLSSRWNASTEM